MVTSFSSIITSSTTKKIAEEDCSSTSQTIMTNKMDKGNNPPSPAPPATINNRKKENKQGETPPLKTPEETKNHPNIQQGLKVRLVIDNARLPTKNLLRLQHEKNKEECSTAVVCSGITTCQEGGGATITNKSNHQKKKHQSFKQQGKIQGPIMSSRMSYHFESHPSCGVMTSPQNKEKNGRMLENYEDKNLTRRGGLPSSAALQQSRWNMMAHERFVVGKTGTDRKLSRPKRSLSPGVENRKNSIKKNYVESNKTNAHGRIEGHWQDQSGPKEEIRHGSTTRSTTVATSSSNSSAVLSNPKNLPHQVSQRRSVNDKAQAATPFHRHNHHHHRPNFPLFPMSIVQRSQFPPCSSQDIITEAISIAESSICKHNKNKRLMTTISTSRSSNSEKMEQ